MDLLKVDEEDNIVKVGFQPAIKCQKVRFEQIWKVNMRGSSCQTLPKIHEILSWDDEEVHEFIILNSHGMIVTVKYLFHYLSGCLKLYLCSLFLLLGHEKCEQVTECQRYGNRTEEMGYQFNFGLIFSLVPGWGPNRIRSGFGSMAYIVKDMNTRY